MAPLAKSCIHFLLGLEIVNERAKFVRVVISPVLAREYLRRADLLSRFFSPFFANETNLFSLAAYGCQNDERKISRF